MKDNKEQDAPVVHWRIDEWFPELNSEVRTQLKSYHEELRRFNRTLSLISAKTLFVADVLHFSDSILATRMVMAAQPKMESIYDLGSGNGFPGLVMAIMNPSLKVNLVEHDQKKAEFLSHISSFLGLQNVSVLNQTIESLKENSIEFAICRNLNTISKVLLLMRKSVAKTGVLFHMKSEEWGIEVGEIPTQLCSIWSPSLVGEYKLPVGQIKFAVIKTDKIG